MKKTIGISLCIAALILIGVMPIVIGEQKNSSDRPTQKSISSNNRLEQKNMDELFDDFAAVKPNSAEFLDVPKYSKKDMFKELGYNLGQDLTVYALTNMLPYYTGKVLMEHPSTAIRVRDDGSKYIVYDTDEGLRLFLFYNDENAYIAPIGRALVVSEKQGYKDFESIKNGSTLADVEAVDKAASLYREYWTGFWDDPACFNNPKGNGICLAILFYLDEGILKIEFNGLNDNMEFVVTGMQLFEDFVVPSDVKKLDRTITVNYQLDEKDIPKACE